MVSFHKNVVSLVIASSALCAKSMVLMDPTSTSTGTLPRTFINKDIKTPDPVPEEGHKLALDLMKTGRMYRYNIGKGEESVVSQCEIDLAAYTGHKYCVALNSCGSAIMLMMKCAGLQPGDEVLSNAFTFGAVPSAIEHAGGKAVYVESTEDYLIDVEDLEKKMVAYPNAKYMLISHMRGKVADMDAIKDACDRHDVILLEDCAHSLGVQYKGKHSGHHGVAAAVSSQSYKMINSGEGGFFLTDNPEMAAKCAVYAGAYEALNSKHVTVPEPKYFEGLSVQLPNYSLRMSNLAASVVIPQIKTLDERIVKYNKRYDDLTAKLTERLGDIVRFPDITEGVYPVHDSVQFQLPQDMTEEQLQLFLDEAAAHGLPIEIFGHKTNARNFVNWGFAPATDPLPQTAKMLKRAADCRLPLMWDDADFDDIANVICESLEVALKSE